MLQIKIFKNSFGRVRKETNEWIKENNHHIEIINTQMGIEDHTQSVIVMITYIEFESEE